MSAKPSQNHPMINRLLKSKVSWLADSGPDDDIAISSRVRLARNLEGARFPINSGDGELERIMNAIRKAVKATKCFERSIDFVLSELTELDRQLLLERRLISREFVDGRRGGGLVISADEVNGMMINEEDHVRLQVMRPGLQLREVWRRIDEIDNRLGAELPFAFHKELGFLTSCPTNVGTGMRVSVMLHLPALVLDEKINAVIHGVSKLGLAVRGIHGEGSDNLGNLYQVSNQSTLGDSEQKIVERLETVIRQIINHEKNSRQNLLDRRQNFLLDHVGRAYGVLRHGYVVSSEEALDSLSALRMGVDLGMFSSVDIHAVNELFIIIQPAHLQKFADKELDSDDRDVCRASLVREKLKTLDKGKET